MLTPSGLISEGQKWIPSAPEPQGSLWAPTATGEYSEDELQL